MIPKKKIHLHPIFIDNLTYLFTKTAGRLKRNLVDSLSPHDLIPPQKGILTLLSQNEDLNQYQMCEDLDINKATMARFLDHMQELGLITRRESNVDRREKLVNITKKGLELSKKLNKIAEELEEEYFNNLNQKEIETLKKLLIKINQ